MYREVPAPLSQLALRLTCHTKVQYENHENDFGLIHRAYLDFTDTRSHLCLRGCACVCVHFRSFIMGSFSQLQPESTYSTVSSQVSFMLTLKC